MGLLFALRLEDRAHYVDGVGLRGRLVGAIALDPREAEGESRGIARGFLDVAKASMDGKSVLVLRQSSVFG